MLQDEPDAAAVAQESDPLERVAVDDDEVGDLARLDRPDVVAEAERVRGRAGRGDERFAGAESMVGHLDELEAEVADRCPVVAGGDRDAGCIGRPERQVGLLEVVQCEVDQEVRPRRGRLGARRRPGVGAGVRGGGAGDAVEAAERRDEHLAGGGHALEQVGALVEVHAVLDGVDAGLDGDLGAVEAFGVGGDAMAHAVGLVDDRRDLLAGHLRGVGVLELDGARAGGHDLDEVGAAPELFADGAADVVGAVGLAVHVAEPAAAGGGGGDDPPAGEQPRAAERAVAHRLAGLEDEVAVGADVADRRDPHAQRRAQVGGQEVRARPGPERLGAGRRGGDVGVDVGVRVDEAGHERAAREVEDRDAVGGRVAGVADARDDAVLDEDGGAVAGRRAGAVEQTRVREVQGIGRRRGRCEERAEARGLDTAGIWGIAVDDHAPTLRIGSLTI